MGCEHQGRAMGLNNIIAADMGGTTFKVGIVRDRPHRIPARVDGAALPLRAAEDGHRLARAGRRQRDLVRSRTGVPRIGPRSAGSYPGRSCYGHGGTEPTITDVDAVLGYMNPRFFLGGRAQLDIERCREAFEEQVAQPLGTAAPGGGRRDLPAGEQHHLRSVAQDDRPARPGPAPLRPVLVRRDRRACTCRRCGDELGVPPVVIPHTASVHGAFGLVTSDIVHEEIIAPACATRPSPRRCERHLRRAARARADAARARTGSPDDRTHPRARSTCATAARCTRSTVPLRGGPGRAVDAMDAAVAADFERGTGSATARARGFREAGVELVTFRVRGAGELPKSKLHSEPGRWHGCGPRRRRARATSGRQPATTAAWRASRDTTSTKLADRQRGSRAGA